MVLGLKNMDTSKMSLGTMGVGVVPHALVWTTSGTSCLGINFARFASSIMVVGG